MKERKLPIILFSLIFAFLVWMSVNLGNQFQTTIDIPIKVENLRQDQAIAVPLPNFVRFKIQGTGWQLLNTLLSPNLFFTIDFNTLTPRDILLSSRELNEHVNLSSNIRIFESSPETVIVRLDEKYSKKIPIQPNISLSYRDGFGIVGDVLSVPDSVVITGARSLLQKFHYWETTPVKLRDINSPISLRALLSDTLQYELTRSVNEVMLLADVQPIAEKTISDIAIEIVQAPENRSIVLIPPKVSIIIRSGVNTIAKTSEKDFYATIDYTSVLLDTSGMVNVTIVGPKNIQIVQKNPEKIQYVVRKQKSL